ncbi:MAG: nucleotidyl transferase AbiEii/AbiGii toxin family protein [Roseiarcus sp.]
MAFAESYRRQVALLMRTLPHVAEEACFALKGGTAINLFVRDMPRLSVDIDLTYLPVEPRPESLSAIDAAMRRIAGRIERAIPGVRITQGLTEAAVTRLTVRAAAVQIKIEVTPVLRGTVYQPEIRSVSPAVESAFGFAEIKVVSFADLYAGKIVAALDRQHPRDFFDVRDLLAEEGISDDLRRAFVVYLLSHDRPMFEVLKAVPKNISAEFLRGFEGMTDAPVTLDDLLDARKRMIEAIVGGMPTAHRHFLVSFERGQPDWPLLGVPGVEALPAVRWREQNLDSLNAAKRRTLVDGLKAVLGLGDDR